jgi:hypothetical protein
MISAKPGVRGHCGTGMVRAGEVLELSDDEIEFGLVE